MTRIFGKQTIRRKEARRHRVEASRSGRRHPLKAVSVFSLLAAAVFFLGAIGIVLLGESSLSYAEGQTLQNDVRARVAFKLLNPTETERARQLASANVPNYYVLNTEFLRNIRGQIQNLFIAAQNSDSLESFREISGVSDKAADEACFEAMRRLNTEEGKAQMEDWLNALRAALANEYLVRKLTPEERAPPSAASTAFLIRPKSAAEGEQELVEHQVSTLDLGQIDSKSVVQGRAAVLANNFPFAAQGAVEEALTRALATEPIYKYDPAKTQRMIQEKVSSTPPVYDQYKKGDILAAEGRLLNQGDMGLLAAENEKFRRFMESAETDAVDLRRQEFLADIGIAALILLLVCGFSVYVWVTQPRIATNPTRAWALAGMLLFLLLVAKIIELRTGFPELVLTPIALAGAILTIAYSRRFSFGATSVLAIMTVLMIGGAVSVMLLLLAGMALPVLMLNHIRTRTKIMGVSFAGGLLAFFTSFAVGLVERQTPAFIAVHSAWAGFAVILALLIVQGILPFIERFFKIATALTLMEWSDSSKPLLQRLARLSPGTYQHSLAVSQLASAACEDIGADALLARIGTLYHDIGKTLKPEYFAENQEAHINRHDFLSPTMSLLVIIGHVKDGIELAREYGLPPVLCQFIEEHHGTTLVKYFHRRAVERQSAVARGKHDREVSESEFRYPGPKPRSRETAILMLCDGVEGAVRALNEPTPGRIEGVVHRIVQERLNDGQFDDCDITMKDLNRVEKSLVKSLCSFYHGRVAYPKPAPPAKDKPVRQGSA